jgi:hypothetical protein
MSSTVGALAPGETVAILDGVARSDGQPLALILSAAAKTVRVRRWDTGAVMRVQREAVDRVEIRTARYCGGPGAVLAQQLKLGVVIDEPLDLEAGDDDE